MRKIFETILGIVIALTVIGGVSALVINKQAKQKETTECRHLNVQTSAAVAPTCTENGWTEGKVCKDCGLVFALKQEVNKLGHAWPNDFETEKSATCTQMGVEVKCCTRCSVELARQTISATGHESTHMESTATCTEAGETREICDTCDEVLSSTPTSAKGHSYLNSTIVKEATCTEAGESVKECSVCHETSVVTIPPFGHTEDDDGYCIECGIPLTNFGVRYTFNEEGSYFEASLPYCSDPSFAERNIVIASTYEVKDGEFAGTYDVKVLGEGFAYNQYIESVVIPGTIEEIPDYAFIGCVNLTSVTLEDGIQSIGNKAFANTGLRELYIPSSVTEVGQGICLYCGIGDEFEFKLQASTAPAEKSFTPDSSDSDEYNYILVGGGEWNLIDPANSVYATVLYDQ